MKNILTDMAKSIIVRLTMAKHKNRNQRRTGNVLTRRGGGTVNKDNKVFGFQTKGHAEPVNTGHNCEVVRGTPVIPSRVGVRTYGYPAAGQQSYVPGGVLPAAAPTFWEVDDAMEMVKSCSVHSKPVNVAISNVAKNKMTILMAKFPGIEWLAYLVGDKDTRRVTDIVIPKQRVTAVNVYVDEPVDVPIIGVVHSHHGMGNNFSHTDDEYINGNHDISLCISNTGIKGQVRLKTDCNRYFLADANVIDIIDNFDTVAFIKDVDEKISKIVYQAPTYQGGYAASRAASGALANGYHPRTGFGLDGEEWDWEGWDTDPASAAAGYTPVTPGIKRELMAAVRDYRKAVTLAAMDEYFVVEFSMLVNLIKSIGTEYYEMWEKAAFDDTDNQYTAEYYEIIDEISNLNDELTPAEKQALNLLAIDLEKRVEVSGLDDIVNNTVAEGEPEDNLTGTVKKVGHITVQ